MPLRREDPRIVAVVNLLPSDGSAISHTAWRQLIIEQGDLSLLKATQNARSAGQVIFEIGDMEDPGATLTVRRAFVAAAPAQPVPQSARTGRTAAQPAAPTTPET